MCNTLQRHACFMSRNNTGDNIIIPKDIRTLATTMSITRNGIKIIKPIWNADFNSLMTNAGTSTRNGADSAFAPSGNFASFANKAKSDCRVCLVIKPRIGSSARPSACSKVIVFFVSGKYASS